MAISSQGQYGVDEGLMFSFPCRRENGIIRVVEGIVMNDYSQLKFQATLDELRSEREAVKALGLLD